MRQTECIFVNRIMIVNFASLLLHDGGSVLRLNDGSLLSLLQAGVWLSMFVVGLTVVQFVVFCCSGFITPLSLLLYFIRMIVILYVSLWCFTEKVNELYADRTYVCNLELHQNCGRVSREYNWFIPSPPPAPIHPPLVFLLFRWLYCCSSLFVRRWFYMWRLFWHYLFLIPPFPREGCASWLWHFLGIFTYICNGPDV